MAYITSGHWLSGWNIESHFVQGVYVFIVVEKI